ncbi:pseudouridine synthase [Corynebacterium pilosum]|uniref:pseudouridine synthase n=1 Tax=Corynebacterium pilosum TaxID=35756 RepID=UPI00037CB841
MATRVVLRDVVPPGEFFAARSGDSPFQPGSLLIPGTALPTPVPAFRFPDVSVEPEIPFHARVLIDDDTLIAVDKPHFLPATPNGRIVRETAQTRLRRHYGEDATVIHRLDRLTAGVLLAVKKPEDRAAYQQLFARREVHKKYVARVHGQLQIDN